jgi:adenosine deaminase
VTLNTDNRFISNTSLSNEYEIAIKTFSLNENQVKTLIINGFKSSFLPHNKRKELIQNIVDELENDFGFSKDPVI